MYLQITFWGSPRVAVGHDKERYMSGTEIGKLTAQGWLSGFWEGAKIIAPYYIAFCLLCVIIALKKRSSKTPKTSKKEASKKYDDLFGLNNPEAQHQEHRPPKRRIPHPTSDKYINKNKKDNYRVVIYKHEHKPKLPIWVIVMICTAAFTLSFVLASIFLV